ncbi:selenite/tellurite reduction operon rhodanese-like protein ExtH [Desulfurivibrio dismutans]|uniref:selenite/tellurite reduction operon rhodanese-like protein ExtH n=1 Tax=Desulfurivibrio dismutans TaxID=1398908 RepID=UPI0023D9F909|nr:selenite/tellurite reduction operon rhodanese-like protein ExtH [Desulfurivibrio alkaliphilus]MDF1614337.1 selenite/tellurite reduction operon rhodanese-like protein ExtH [Desulfurivibrio alkaliphilus]
MATKRLTPQKSARLYALLGLLAGAMLLLTGCGGNDYDADAAANNNPDVMIDAKTLNNWVEGGYGTDAKGYDRMVILDVDSAAGYESGHIPGAFHLDTVDDLRAERSNGVSYTASQVPTAAQMDNLMQRTGTDERTVVVLVGDGNMMSVGRAYFNFRYWGFPRERLRVLNGTKTATYHNEAGYPLSETPPPPRSSNYSVTDLQANVNLRASLEEMIAVAENGAESTIVLDARSEGEYEGESLRGGVAFGGRVRGAKLQEWSTLLDPDNPTAMLNKNELRTMMEEAGAGPDTISYTYCQTSWRAAVNFLALDAVLRWPAKIYDGAWVQWGMMARNDLNYGGALAPDSPWRTDNESRSEAINYENRIVEPLASADSFAPRADLINVTDQNVCDNNPPAPDDRAVEVMLSLADLEAWQQDGAPTAPADPYDYDNFVVLHVGSTAAYEEGHIPGAFLLNTAADLSATRNDGIAPTISQVPTSAQMNDLLQRTGIGADTIIVLTTGSGAANMMHLGRAYFNFRYWGFPRERLRVLDGNAGHYAEATGITLSTEAPAEAASEYNVCELPQDTAKERFRASLEEMMAVTDGSATPMGAVPANYVIIDARSAAEYNGDPGTTWVANNLARTYVAFEGHIKGAEHQDWVTLLDETGRLLPVAELTAAMNDLGSSDTTTNYSYCRTSWRAGVTFLALDAALNWPAKIYDGAWIEWGQMARNEPLYDGSLNPVSPWRTDKAAYSEEITYNKTNNTAYLGANSYAPFANRINQEDAAISGAPCCVETDPGAFEPIPDGIAPTAPGYR